MQNTPTLQDAFKLMKQGDVLYNKDKLNAALENYESAMAIFNKTHQKNDKRNSLNSILDPVLDLYYNLTGADQWKPTPLNFAISFNNMGNVYESQGKFDQALRHYKKAFKIQQEKAPNSLVVAISLSGIASVYESQGKLNLALQHYLNALEIQQEKAPNSLVVAISLSGIAGVYYFQDKLDLALQYYLNALEIQQEKAPNSLDLATSFNNIAVIYESQGKLNLALQHYLNALEIQQEKAPNSLTVAYSLSNIGVINEYQGKFNQALDLHQKAYKIRHRNLIATHPDLIISANRIADCAMKLADKNIEVSTNVNQALEYANIVISKDPRYKFAYLTKALALQKQGKLNESLGVLSQALSIDSSYADAKLAQIKLLTQVAESEAKKSDKTSFKKIAKQVIENIKEAKEIKPSTYDQDYIARKIAELVLVEIKDVKIELPKSEFQASDERFKRELEIRLKKLEELSEAQGIKLNQHEERYLQQNHNAENLNFEDQSGQGQQLQRKESVITGEIVKKLKEADVSRQDASTSSRQNASTSDASRLDATTSSRQDTNIPATREASRREGQATSATRDNARRESHAISTNHNPEEKEDLLIPQSRIYNPRNASYISGVKEKCSVM